MCHESSPTTYQLQQPTTLEDHIPINDKWVVQSLHHKDNGQYISQGIILGKAVAVCNGSYKDQFGTAGFVIQNGNNQEQRITGANVTPGHPNKMNPYRSEIAGIFAIVVIIEAIASFHDLQEGIIELGCDCELGITAIFTHKYDTPKQPHHDLIYEIHQKIENSKLTWNYRHVRGHQDKHATYNMLDMWGQLNVEMDTLAKVYWNETNTCIDPFYPTSTFEWSLWTGARKLSNWDRQPLYNHARSTEILDHWS
jgi:hypothetical protein